MPRLRTAKSHQPAPEPIHVEMHPKANGSAEPHATTLTVRAGVPADERECYRLLLLASAENSIFPANNARVAYFVQSFLWAATPHRLPTDPRPLGRIGVIGPVGGRLEALCVLGVSHGMWYSDRKFLEEYVLYVDPECRRPNRGHATALMQWLKQMVDETGLPLITGILSDHRTAAKVRLYERQFQSVGRYFMYVPNGYIWNTDLLLGKSVISSSLAA